MAVVRKWRTLVMATALLSALAAVVVAAVLADGRAGSESTTNDGGAWLLNRSVGAIGHVNRVVGEIESTVGPFTGRFEVEQSDRVVLVHDRGAGQLALVDTFLSQPGATIAAPASIEAMAVPGRVVAHDPETGRVWLVDREEFGTVDSIDGHDPILEVSPGSLVVAGRDGTIVVVDDGAGLVHVAPPGGATRSLDWTGGEVVDATVVDSNPVLLLDDGRLATTIDDRLVAGEADTGIVRLQQPSDAGDDGAAGDDDGAGAAVVGIDADGTVVEVALDTFEARRGDTLVGGEPLAPIVHRGCVWTVTVAPTPTFHHCGRSTELPGAGPDVRITLVNGWVWVNDVDQGGIWFVREQELEVEEISDWTAALDITDDEAEVDEDGGGDEEEVENAAADDLAEDIDELDDDDRNTPPVAEDDEAATRRGAPVVVPVLDNDSDEDNDPLAVEELRGVDADGFDAQGALVSITPDGRGVQVQPPVDFVGEIRFGYVVHDGRQGRDDAEVVVRVNDPDPAGNRPPVTEVDNATVRADGSVSLNALSNDRDPDGDSMVLVAVEAVGGAVNFAPDGELTYRPDVDSAAGTVDLAYTVADSLGAEAAGTIRVRVRPIDSNQAPQARNDVGRTSVGRPVIVDVLANDTDPDGDPLVPQNLQGADGVLDGAQLSPDGRFLFRPEAPGTYRFTYVVSDGPLIDTAQIRIDVDESDANRPPVAVLDEVALAIGESRLVRVLDNDGDPDGDVVGIVEWIGADGLEIDEVPGVGFNVLATPTAEPRSSFRYWISDGLAAPVRGEVVVSALEREAVDYPPIAVNDVVDVRAGQTAQLHVLRNDRDPEGRFLRLVEPVPEITEGLVRLSPDRQTILLTTDPDQEFSFQFAYSVADPAGFRDSAIVDVRVVDPRRANRAPVAGPDVARTPAGTPVVVRVLDNDVDPDGDPITVESIAQQPSNGTVELSDDGSIRYTPAAGFTGTDRFVYTVVDGYQAPTDADALDGADGETTDDGSGDATTEQAGAARSLGEVFVGVMPIASANRPPTAVDDLGFPAVPVGGDPVVLDVLANDSDPDADPIRVSAVTAVGRGEVEIVRRGSRIEYSPPADGDAGSVSFVYSIADGRGGTASAQVVLDLDAEPDPVPPEAVDDTVGPVRARQTISFDPRGNDVDADGDATLLVVESDDPALTVLPDGAVEIVAPSRTTDVVYRVRDEQGLLSAPGFITVLVTENEPPSVEPIAVETPSATPVTIDLHDATSDPDGDPLVITLGEQRTGGSVAVVGDPGDDFLRVSFTPDAEFAGTGGFDFFVDDRFGHTVAGNVVVEVLPPENRPPEATPVSITVDAGVPGLVRLPDSVTDPDGPDGHSFRIDGPANGNVTLDGPSGSGEVWIGTDVAGGGVADEFTYTVVDGEFEATATVSIDVRVPDFPPPTLRGDSARVLQGQPTPPIDLLANDVDNSPSELRGDGLVVTEVGVSPDGDVALDGSTVVFTPDPDFFGVTEFTYTVQDGRRSVDRQSTALVTVEVVGRPDQPQPPTIDTIGNRYLIVVWQPPQGASSRAPVTGYVLSFVADDGTTGEITFDQPTTSYRWENLTNAVEYCFRVAAVNEAGVGDPSTAPGTCAVPDVRPEAPPTPTVEFGDGELRVRWGAARNQGSPIENYRLRISGGESDLSAPLGVVNEFVWEGLDNGTDYTFEVQAQNAALENDGWSEWSPLSAPEHPLTLPDAPARPDAVRGDRQVQITWRAPYDGGDRITRYQVRSSLGPRWIDVTPQGATNTYTWEDIPNGTDVSFEVRAINRDPSSTTPGNISPSSPVVRTCSVPDAPPKPQVTRGDRQVTVTWQRPADQGCAISEYRITGSPGGTQTAGPGATQHVFTGLTNGTASTFTVTAVNEVVTVDGVDAKPSPATDSVTPAGRPGVTNVTAADNVGVRQVRVRWSAADPNGSPIIRYQLRVNGGAWQDVGNVREVTRTEGSDGATYTYRVRAVNDVGPSQQTGASQSVTTWSRPGTPNVSASGGDRRVTGTWNSPSNGGTALTGHQGKLTTGTCSSSGTTRSSPGSPETWTGLAQDTQYRVCVRYRNAVGWGNWGADTARTDPPPPPPARKIVVSRGAPNRIADGTCSVGECRYIDIDATNYAPGRVTTHEIYINGSLWRSRRAVFNSNGRATQVDGVDIRGELDGAPFVGPGYGTVRVVIDGVSSNTVDW